MVLLSEINGLRATTLFLLAILIGLSFYLIIESWNRCEKFALKLTQELNELRELLAVAENENYIGSLNIFTDIYKVA